MLHWLVERVLKILSLLNKTSNAAKQNNHCMILTMLLSCLIHQLSHVCKVVPILHMCDVMKIIKYVTKPGHLILPTMLALFSNSQMLMHTIKISPA